IRDGVSQAMVVVGDKFSSGEYFLADLVMSGEVVEEAMLLLQDKLDAADIYNRGKVILATVKGDLHDLGKSIVSMMLSASGFEVIDLGVDVSEEKIVQAVKDSGAQVVGLTMLLTTAAGSVKDVVDAFIEAGMRDKVRIAIGGASANQRLAEESGADAYGEDAVKAVAIFDRFLQEV
ncbi:MAG: cobalamin-dependent protein, partial [Deltaproteobacteria bacterium]|nr:cobalamin-dependent protein [Deltaproteobacteria bacterium]